jgi:hypothetical protein
MVRILAIKSIDQNVSKMNGSFLGLPEMPKLQTSAKLGVSVARDALENCRRGRD